MRPVGGRGKISTWSPPNLNFRVRFTSKAIYKVKDRIKDRVTVRDIDVMVRFLLSV